MEPNRRCTSEPAQLRMQYHRQSVAYCHYRGIEITQSLQGLASAPPKRCKKTVRPGDTPHNSQQHSEEQNLHRQKHWIGSKPRTPDRELRQEGHIKKPQPGAGQLFARQKALCGHSTERRTGGEPSERMWPLLGLFSTAATYQGLPHRSGPIASLARIWPNLQLLPQAFCYINPCLLPKSFRC